MVAWLLTLAFAGGVSSVAHASQDGATELLERARALVADGADSSAIYALQSEVLEYFQGTLPLDDATALEVVDVLQGGYLANALPGDVNARDDALLAAYEASFALRERSVVLSAELLGRQLELAEGSDYEYWVLIALTNSLRFLGQLSEAEVALEKARRLLMPVEIDAFEFEPADESELGQLVYWLEAKVSCLFDAGAMDSAALHAQQLARRAREMSNPNSVFMAIETQMRVALNVRALGLVSELWKKAQTEPLLHEFPRSEIAKLEYLRWWCEVDLERRGNGAESDPEPELIRLIEDAEVQDTERWGAGLALALLYIDRGLEAQAAQLLERMPGGDDGDRNLMRLAVELRTHRLGSRLDELERAEATARKAFDQLLEEWGSSASGRSERGLLQLVVRSTFIVEILRARMALDPGVDGVRAAFEMIFEIHKLVDPAQAATSEFDDLLRTLRSDGRCTLVFIPSRLGSLVLAVTPDSLESAELEGYDRLVDARANLDAAAVRLLQNPSRQREPEFDEAIARATDAFMPSEVRRIVGEAHEIVVIGAEDYGWPVFELFEFQPGRPLGLERAVSYLSTLTEAVRLGRDWSTLQSEFSGATVVIADRVGSNSRTGEFSVLPIGEREQAIAVNAAAAFEGEHGEVLTDSQASLAGLRGLPPRRMWTIVAHGIFDPRRAEPAGLRLASPSLGAIDVFSGSISELEAPPLVALFGCRAGAALDRRGSGGGNLASAFHRAGARAVALSTTELDYRRSLELGAAFSEEVATGIPMSDALLRARRAMAEASGDYPINALLIRLHGWGPSALVEEPALEPKTRARFLIPLALMMLGVAVVFLVKRRRLAG